MQQQYIEFKITHQRLERIDEFFVVGETKNYLKARFSFSDDWADEDPIIIFAAGCRPFGSELVNGECDVPWEVLQHERFLVSCVAGDRITTNAVTVPVRQTNATDDLVPPSEPTPSVLDAKISVAIKKWMKDNPIGEGGYTIDLEAYATKEYVTEQISNTDYVTSDALIDYPTTEAMESYVADQINNTDYVTPEVLNEYATTEAMESYVTDQITNIDYITPDVLTDYTTVDHVETYVADQINNCGHITADALTDYATVGEVETYVDEAVKNVKFTETDPTVPAWAKQPTKPAYTAAEVGAATPEDITNALANLPTGGGKKPWRKLADIDFSLEKNQITIFDWTDLDGVTDIYIKINGAQNSSAAASGYDLYINGKNIAQAFAPSQKNGTVQYWWAAANYDGLVWNPSKTSGTVDGNWPIMGGHAFVPYNKFFEIGAAENISLKVANSAYKNVAGTWEVHVR